MSEQLEMSLNTLTLAESGYDAEWDCILSVDSGNA